MILPPKEMTWQRGWRFVGHPESTLLRLLEYDCIRGLRLEGTTLDVGGGTTSSYQTVLAAQGMVHSVNADPRIGATYLADLNRGIPVADNSYDNVVSFNTLEHIWSDVLVLEEMFRVLKPGGCLHVIVPFLYRVHASPSDYHRRTAHFWDAALAQVGFPRTDIEVTPLTFGPFGAALSLVEFRLGALTRRLLRVAMLLSPILMANLCGRPALDKTADIPLGYWLQARK